MPIFSCYYDFSVPIFRLFMAQTGEEQKFVRTGLILICINQINPIPIIRFTAIHIIRAGIDWAVCTQNNQVLIMTGDDVEPYPSGNTKSQHFMIQFTELFTETGAIHLTQRPGVTVI